MSDPYANTQRMCNVSDDVVKGVFSAPGVVGVVGDEVEKVTWIVAHASANTRIRSRTFKGSIIRSMRDAKGVCSERVRISSTRMGKVRHAMSVSSSTVGIVMSSTTQSSVKGPWCLIHVAASDECTVPPAKVLRPVQHCLETHVRKRCEPVPHCSTAACAHTVHTSKYSADLGTRHSRQREQKKRSHL